MTHSIIPLFIPHLGCPNDCVFCNQRAIAAPQAPTARQVTQLIRQGLNHASRPQIAFYGGSFTAISAALQEEYLGAAFPFVQSGQCDSIRLSTRPDAIDEATLARLARYGVRTVELGAQSMDDGVLQQSRRGHTARQTVEASRLVQQAGFELILQVMAGLPGDSRALCLSTAWRVAALRPAGVRIYPVCVIEHTPLCRMMEQGTYTPLTVDQAADWCADMLDVFQRQHIPVVRIGLNPTDELSGGAVKGGAYHPAMGELVRSRLLRRQAADRLQTAPPGAHVALTVPRGRLSILRGQKNCNTAWFAQQFPHLTITLAESPTQTEPLLLLYKDT